MERERERERKKREHEEGEGRGERPEIGFQCYQFAAATALAAWGRRGQRRGGDNEGEEEKEGRRKCYYPNSPPPSHAGRKVVDFVKWKEETPPVKIGTFSLVTRRVLYLKKKKLNPIRY